eukprot:scaffold22439_cov108-Isochrysis_galbana.AAC.4
MAPSAWSRAICAPATAPSPLPAVRRARQKAESIVQCPTYTSALAHSAPGRGGAAAPGPRRSRRSPPLLRPSSVESRRWRRDGSQHGRPPWEYRKGGRPVRVLRRSCATEAATAAAQIESAGAARAKLGHCLSIQKRKAPNPQCVACTCRYRSGAIDAPHQSGGEWRFTAPSGLVQKRR